MRLNWGQSKDGTYEAVAREGEYRIVPRGNEWCLEKPYPNPGRIGGFATPAEAMAWGQDLHHAAKGPRVRTPQPSWPTVDEFAEVVDVHPTALRSWLATHDSGSTSPRRRLDPTTQQRIRTFYKTHTNR
jgi:hypothetical protein